MNTTNIPTTRAAHLLLFCDILSDIGTPVEREIERSGLPVNMAEMPDALVNNVIGTQFVGRCGRLEGVEDLGWLGAKHFALSSFTDVVTHGLKVRASLRGKLELFRAMSALEDSHLQVEIIGRDRLADLVCNMLLPTDLVGMNCGEWVQLAVMIGIVRSVIGAHWAPHSINFRTVFEPAEEARCAFPNTRFQFGQAKTSITIDAELLECCNLGDDPGYKDPCDMTPPCQLDTIKQLIRPYLLSAPPPIELFAEMVDTSVRSFQRWLSTNGTSYRDLVNETRTEIAREMLLDDSLSLMQIALHLGYENQSNFGRNFKKMTGVSPAFYRRGLKKTQVVRELLSA